MVAGKCVPDIFNRIYPYIRLDSCLRDISASMHKIAQEWPWQNVLTTVSIVIHMIEGACAFCRDQNQRGRD